MRLVKDIEGDIWEEVSPGKYACPSLIGQRDLKYIEAKYGPVKVFAEIEVDE